jgi:deoxyribonuclease-4
LHARPGDGSVNTYDEFARILDKYAQSLGDQALSQLHIHLSGILYGEKGEKEHLKLQESDLNLPALFKALAEFKCQGRILCESPIMEEDALYMQELWNKT